MRKYLTSLIICLALALALFEIGSAMTDDFGWQVIKQLIGLVFLGACGLVLIAGILIIDKIAGPK